MHHFLQRSRLGACRYITKFRRADSRTIVLYLLNEMPEFHGNIHMPRWFEFFPSSQKQNSFVWDSIWEPASSWSLLSL